MLHSVGSKQKIHKINEWKQDILLLVFQYFAENTNVYSQFPMQYHLDQTVENQGKFGSDYYTMKEKESNTIEKRISCSTR